MTETTPPPPLATACLVLAPTAAPDALDAPPLDPAALDAAVRAIVATAAAAGAEPIVAALPGGHVAPAPARTVPIGPRARGASALRPALAQLANTTVTGVLLWSAAELPTADAGDVRALVEARHRAGAALVLAAGARRRGAPVLVARELWLDLMTTHDAADPDALLRRYRERALELPLPAHEVRTHGPS